METLSGCRLSEVDFQVSKQISAFLVAGGGMQTLCKWDWKCRWTEPSQLAVWDIATSHSLYDQSFNGNTESKLYFLKPRIGVLTSHSYRKISQALPSTETRPEWMFFSTTQYKSVHMYFKIPREVRSLILFQSSYRTVTVVPRNTKSGFGFRRRGIKNEESFCHPTRPL
ncbi:hypothetical protein N657DRAFT_270327 [Parathielavia appendiculata]|uniref:Uncharacterized protein n=1 Tax=Parathielavia appendiculata TaxID=2587402 RepID=A0AAN6U319_9PEZI|nr:hypothetical protein N657DRAFT_270327 [Parathielavia appendiculata]